MYFYVSRFYLHHQGDIRTTQSSIPEDGNTYFFSNDFSILLFLASTLHNSFRCSKVGIATATALFFFPLLYKLK
jgi:hypothetical protein